MYYIPIKTSQNISINYPLAGLGKRIPAAIIDLIIVFVYWYVMYLLVFKILGKSLEPYYKMNDYEYEKWVNRRSALKVLFILFTLPAYIYHFLCESFLDGQSFGKKIMKIRVAMLDGTQPDFRALALRSAFRLVDVFLFMGIGSVITIITTSKGQRLGDLAAGTTVISLSDFPITLGRLEELLGENSKSKEQHPDFIHVTLLSDHDIYIVMQALKNTDSLGPEALKKLAEKIKEKISYPHPVMKPVDFLNRVCEAYKKAEFKEEIL